MNRGILIFDDIGIDKRQFRYAENSIWIDDTDIVRDRYLSFFWLKRVINILLVPKMMIIKLSNCV